MKIGIDIDGTITDLHNEILRYGLKYNKRINGNGIKNKDEYRISDIFDWSIENCSEFKRYMQMEILNRIKPRKHVTKCLKKLKKMGNEIYIITGRKSTEMRDTYNETIKWIKNNKIPFDKFIMEEENKGIACKKNGIDVFVDDSVKHLDRIYKEGIKELYIFDNVYNKDDNRYNRIYSFDDLYYNIDKNNKY